MGNHQDEVPLFSLTHLQMKMLTVEAGSGWWLTSLKQRLEEKENRQCVCEGDSE